jgi:UDP-glucuronate 4-epimerase
VHVLVTGGAGFIGSQLCEILVARDHRVTCLDCFDDYYDPAIKERNLASLQGDGRFRLVRGDIRDRELVDGLFGEGLDRVVHLAARAGPRPSLADPQLYNEVNVLGTLGLLQASVRHGLGSFLFVSSSSVYGLNTKMPFQESDPINQPASPYGATKGAAELLCHAFAHAHGLPTTVFRLFTVYGPRQRPDMALMKFATLIRAGRPIEVYGDGTSVRGYTYVADVVRAMEAALDRPFPHAIFNIGGGRRVALNELIATLGRELGEAPVLQHVEPQVGDVPATWADVSRASDLLDFRAEVEFEDGVARFCRWFDRVREGVE